jgi:hypothetical protein
VWRNPCPSDATHCDRSPPGLCRHRCVGLRSNGAGTSIYRQSRLRYRGAICFGIDADTRMTYPKRRVDVWLLPQRDWLIDIGVSVGPNPGRKPQRVVIHVQVPWTSLRPTSLREDRSDSFTTRPCQADSSLILLSRYREERVASRLTLCSLCGATYLFVGV